MSGRRVNLCVRETGRIDGSERQEGLVRPGDGGLVGPGDREDWWVRET